MLARASRVLFSSLHQKSGSLLKSAFTSSSETKHVTNFFNKVNKLVDESQRSRNFAVVHMYGKQKFVKEGDMFLVHKDIPAKNGDRIKIEKCLLFGNENITLLGRPLLDRNLVHVEATLVEKTHSHTYMGVIRLLKKKRGLRRWYFQRHPLSVLRINEIKVCHPINENQTVVQ